jgi:hypothetical protein
VQYGLLFFFCECDPACKSVLSTSVEETKDLVIAEVDFIEVERAVLSTSSPGRVERRICRHVSGELEFGVFAATTASARVFAGIRRILFVGAKPTSLSAPAFVHADAAKALEEGKGLVVIVADEGVLRDELG